MITITKKIKKKKKKVRKRRLVKVDFTFLSNNGQS